MKFYSVEIEQWNFNQTKICASTVHVNVSHFFSREHGIMYLVFKVFVAVIEEQKKITRKTVGIVRQIKIRVF